MLEPEYQLITGLMQQPGFPQQPGLLQAGLMQAGLMQTGVVQHPGIMQQPGLAQPGMWPQGGVVLPCPLQGSSLQPHDLGGAQQGAGMC